MMTIDYSQIQSFIANFPLVVANDQIKNGMFRLATPLQYGDGSNIDVFLGGPEDMLDFYTLTDLGQTTAYLLDLHIKPWSTKRRRRVVEDVCESLGVRCDGGELRIVFPKSELPKLPELMLRLAQACLRVSDLALTQNFRILPDFNEDLEEFIVAADLDYDPGFCLPGRYGRDVRVDFRVRGKTATTLVQTMSTANRTAAHGMSLEVFTRWYDLEAHKNNHQFLTVYDTSNDSFRDEDLARLRDQSQVLGFPAEPDRVRELLKAA